MNVFRGTREELEKLTVQCENGEYPPGERFRWESLASMRQRMRRVADRYSDYDKVILVGHGMVFRCLTYIEKMYPTEIIECTYQKGQAECEYSFT